MATNEKVQFLQGNWHLSDQEPSSVWVPYAEDYAGYGWRKEGIQPALQEIKCCPQKSCEAICLAGYTGIEACWAADDVEELFRQVSPLETAFKRHESRKQLVEGATR